MNPSRGPTYFSLGYSVSGVGGGAACDGPACDGPDGLDVLFLLRRFDISKVVNNLLQSERSSKDNEEDRRRGRIVENFWFYQYHCAFI